MLEYAAFAGLELDDWQDDIVLCGLAEDAPDHWASFEVAEVVPRQNGKGDPLQVIELGFLFLPTDGELGLHTAHELKTSLEHMRKLVTVINNTPDLRRQVATIRTARGSEAIELKNGKRLLFIARSEASGRGFTGDLVVFDEAYKLNVDAIGALLPTMSSRPNPQIWYASSAPMSHSQQLHSVRQRALNGRAQRLTYFEWSAGETFAEIEHRLSDVALWRMSNPAMPHRISDDFVAAEFQAMSAAPEVFARERLGVPDRPADEIGDTTMTATWRDRLDPTAAPADPVSLAFDVTPEHDRASIVACGAHDGAAVVELIANEPGTHWVVARLAGLIERHRPAMVVADLRGPAGSLAADLTRAGIEVRSVTPAEHGQACGLFQENTPLHRGQPELTSAVAGAARRPMGDTWLWSRRSSKVDISPLVAATLAHWAHRQPAVASVGVVNLADYLEDDDE